MRPQAVKSGLILGLTIALMIGGGSTARAQLQMPDMKQMSGIPRPVTDLPEHTISVRLIRGTLSNNLNGVPVELHVGAKTVTVKTDEAGHAQFADVTPGATVKAVAVVDGERLESQEFSAPARGAIRLMLVASERAKPGLPVPLAPVTGQVSLGGQSRIIIEPGDEAAQVYYLLEIVNSARAPVNTVQAFEFDMPAGALGTAILEGSSPQASTAGARVRVQGPFAPGRTSVQVACQFTASSGSLSITQRFPAQLDALAVIVKKVGSMGIASPQIATQREMQAEGETFIAATGGAVPAGQPIVLTLDDLPHHSAAPQSLALALAVAIVAIGIWAGGRPAGDRSASDAERTRLLARRDRLFADLVRLETDHRNGRGDRSRYAGRREELVTALEHVYGALDHDDTTPEPAGRAGLAA
jgi:hypothetical protein